MSKIFARSELIHGLKYTGYLGDGDSKSYNTVAKALPYGPSQGHRGAAIRSNVGHLAGMNKSIWATYEHRSGNHADCGDWCPAVKCGNLAKANANGFLPFVLQEIKPAYEELTKDSLLLKCVHGGSQYSNESLHNIWTSCPKTSFVGRMRMELGAFDAVIC